MAVGSSQPVTVSAVSLDAAQTESLGTVWPQDMLVAVGVPVSVDTAGALPEGGVRITRTWTQPLPDGMAASLAFYDTTWGGWHAVPSQVAADRRSVSAVVHHLSIWTDIVGAVTAANQAAQQAFATAGEWAFYQVGKVFDTRVAPPTCTGKPAWLTSSTFMITDKNNSLNFCVGADPKDPTRVVVKVTNNRGFAHAATITPKTAWVRNTGMDPADLTDILAAAGKLNEDLSHTWSLFVPPGAILLEPGKELSFSATEAQIRALGDKTTVLTLDKPTALSFLISLLGQLVGTQIGDLADGYVVAAMAISSCSADLLKATDGGTRTKAALTCLSTIQTSLAQRVAEYLTSRGKDPAVVGKLAGSIAAKITMVLAITGPIFTTANYIGERTVPDSARRVDLFTTTPKSTAALKWVRVDPWANGRDASAEVADPAGDPFRCHPSETLADRSDAYYCIHFDTVSDPCFLNPSDSSRLLCGGYKDQWGLIEDATVNDVNPGANDGGVGVQPAYMVHLTNGATCQRAILLGDYAPPRDGLLVAGLCMSGPYGEDGAIWWATPEATGDAYNVMVARGQTWQVVVGDAGTIETVDIAYH